MNLKNIKKIDMDMNILFKSIIGSHAYGTSTDTSDIDIKGIYIQPNIELFSIGGYKEQINISADECYYEVKRFIELLQKSNPNALELLFSPEDCILYKSHLLNPLFENKKIFLTKQCAKTFGGYASNQIQKAAGLDKKQNWEKDKITRKTPLDFLYIEINGKSHPIKEYFKNMGFKQEKCGLVKLNHMKDCYCLYYDDLNKFGFKGIIKKDSNELRLSSIPKGLFSQAVIYYNSDGYSMHCKDYKEYEDWLSKRNEHRYVDVKSHGQKIDGKNMLHCVRLLDVATEILEFGELNIRRLNADMLLDIRRGKYNLHEIIEMSKDRISKLDELYSKSNLPDEVDVNMLNDILINIRMKS